jgi:CheY-like chemotaxis protein
MNATKGTILLVDDDPAILLSVGDQLSFEGYEVIKASTAEQAIERLGSHTPDLIILDISMPGIGGMGFLKHISQPGGGMKYPVLVFTARAELNSFFAETNVDGFLPKIVDPDTLLQEVAHLIQKRRLVPETAADGAARHRIIIAEDDRDVREDIIGTFLNHGHHAWGVESGFAILEAVVRHQPTVVLLKYILPLMNGPTIAQMLSGLPSTRDIPIVLYDDSGHASTTKYPYVKAFVQTADGKALLKAVQTVGAAPKATAPYPAPPA